MVFLDIFLHPTLINCALYYLTPTSGPTVFIDRSARTGDDYEQEQGDAHGSGAAMGKFGVVGTGGSSTGRESSSARPLAPHPLVPHSLAPSLNSIQPAAFGSTTESLGSSLGSVSRFVLVS